MDWKNMFSALLGFSAVVFLHMPQSAMLTRGGNNIYVPLFVIVLVSQVLLEIMAKYQGKLCETIEGLFTALVAVLGYTFYVTLAQRGLAGGTTMYQQTVGYGTTGGYATTQSGATTGTMGQALLAGAIVALFLFIWKKWLKPRLGINTALCPTMGEQVVYRPLPQAQVQQVPVQEQQPQALPPAQQQPEQFVSY